MAAFSELNRTIFFAYQKKVSRTGSERGMSSLGISIELLNFGSITTPWCNGNTAGFGPAIQGSSPCGVALKPLERFVSGAFCVSVPHYVPRFQNTPKQTRISNTTKARLLSLKPLRSSAAMSRGPLENVAVLLRVFLWLILRVGNAAEAKKTPPHRRDREESFSGVFIKCW